jgi:dTDP-L-rhamnose 4-epimerase
LLTGDVTHAADWDAVLKLVRPTQIVHLAAETGTGQSLSEANRHGSVNVVGTTQMIDALTRAELIPEQLVLASSRAVYGEGAWRVGDDVFYPGPRTHSQLAAGHWRPKGAEDDSAVPLPSSAASTEPRPTSVYAATKLAQEHILQAWTAAHGSGLTVLRLQNVYGPGQSLQNPYTGVVSYFFSSAQEGQALEVYEDGQILRDFVFIDDVVDALATAIEHPVPQTRRLDIGSGAATSIHELACRIASLCGAPEPVVVGKFRDGDIRVAICDNHPATDQLGWAPKWTLEGGLRALLDSFGVRPEASL